MSKKQAYIHFQCLNCGTELPEGRTVIRKFCNHNCGVSWRTKNVYRYKYTYVHRSSSPRNFINVLLSKKNRKKNLNTDQVYELYNKQNGLCAVTKIPMTYIGGQGRVGTNISIDQIIPSGGYTIDNIQLVTSDVNWIKGTKTMDDLYKLCELILEKRNGKHD